MSKDKDPSKSAMLPDKLSVASWSLREEAVASMV
ncbi:hypothetical protein FNYG_13356 [Fusarium nygamai]|uniref:Uncharacterized protein n=1 Tax=Gibberella nygamai TaxID=42673 RepID=A0A2K0VTH1_GIBNY|nr:hypothetical protein FNYG_13356 [Fusarium nygamai]